MTGTRVTRLSFLTLQRGNAVLDALRPTLSVQRRRAGKRN
nr:DUF1534 domain-containing protein [Pseudomonas congelans]